ncbi:hypothetical protein Ahy_A04g017736 [Arachis hypogaea]|uniref:Thioredoxin domain-containing protein n=1 Tax=Arachis hypogaea TaxID=3818 RepID=A0A445DBY3_ARAHY|nr:hypothetical protein Ahy_A04g017736 [Arachis hypogaea]
MGGVLSAVLGGDAAAATTEGGSAEDSHVKSFHSSPRFQLHFNELKDSSKLDVAKDFKVQAMPTFVLVKQGKEIDRIVGAKKDELEKKVKQYRA